MASSRRGLIWEDLPESDMVEDRRGEGPSSTLRQMGGLRRVQTDLTPGDPSGPLAESLGVNDVLRHAGAGVMSIRFTGPAKRLEDIDLPRVGRRIGVGEDEIHAIIDVEAAGKGFDDKGRVKMLFEPHVFYRNLSGAKRTEAVRKGLAYKDWKPGAYPADSYPRLEKAMVIDETAALKSASWGLGQILGENHRAAGYPTVQAMVRDFTLDEDNHLEAMIQFIVSKGLDKYVRAHNWAAFALGYNGPKYAVHGYHTRLAAAYKKWSRIRDTPYDETEAEASAHLSEAEVPEDGEDTSDDKEQISDEAEQDADDEDASSPMSKIQRRAHQIALKNLGFYEVGLTDGNPGSRTVAAVAAFQLERGLPVNGQLDEATIAEISVATDEHWKRPISTERAEGKPENSKIIDGAEKAGSGGVIAAVVGFFTWVGSWVQDNVPFARDVFETARPLIAPFRAFVVDNFGLLLFVIGVLVVWQASKIYRVRVEEHRKGELS